MPWVWPQKDRRKETNKQELSGEWYPKKRYKALRARRTRGSAFRWVAKEETQTVRSPSGSPKSGVGFAGSRPRAEQQVRARESSEKGSLERGAGGRASEGSPRVGRERPGWSPQGSGCERWPRLGWPPWAGGRIDGFQKFTDSEPDWGGRVRGQRYRREREDSHRPPRLQDHCLSEKDEWREEVRAGKSS